MKKRSEEQIIKAIKEHETGAKISRRFSQSVGFFC